MRLCMKAQRLFQFFFLVSLCFVVSLQAISAPTQRLAQLQVEQADQDYESLAYGSLKEGFQFYQNQQFSSALNSFKKALSLYKKARNWRGQAQALGALGAVFLVIDDYPGAIDASKQQLAIAQQYNAPDLLAQAWGNLGIAYSELGNYSASISAHQKALKEMQRQDNHIGEGQVLGNLANTYMALGEYELVEVTYQKSLNIAKAYQDRDGELAALVNMGVLYANRFADYEKAIEYYELALKIADIEKKKIEKTSILINLGSAYHARANGDLARLDQAIQYYKRGLDIATSIPNLKLQAEILGSLGIIYEDLGNYQQATDYQRQSLEIARETKHSNLTAQALNNLAHISLTIGRQKRDRSKLKEAENLLRQSLQIKDEVRKGLQDVQSISMFDTQVHSYNLLQQVLVELEETEKALEASEWGRTRTFINLLSRRIHARNEGVDQVSPPTINQIRQIASQQKATLVEYSFIPDDQFKFRGKLQGPSASLFIWVVKPTGEIAFRSVNLKSKKIALPELVSDSREAIGARGRAGLIPAFSPKLTAQQEERQKKKLKQLHELLIAPISDLLPGNSSDRVIFIPQNELFLVPFPALQNTSGKSLIEKHTILTAPSIQLLELTWKQRQQQINQTKDQKIRVNLVVGNPIMPEVRLPGKDEPVQLANLPGAAQEAENIAKILETRAIIGAEATEVAVTQQLPDARLAHFATHGLLDDFKGMGIPGAIVLAPDNSQQKSDGLLTADEILDMKLNAELVVLSACDTGRGRITGDGVVGLSRSLITAGVPSIIVSLWKVPDNATALLMTEFYKNRQRNHDKAQALRQAMLTTKQKHPDPLAWSAFTLIGESF